MSKSLVIYLTSALLTAACHAAGNHHHEGDSEHLHSEHDHVDDHVDDHDDAAEAIEDHEEHDHSDDQHEDHDPSRDSHAGHDDHAQGEHEDENVVTLSPEVLQEFDIELKVARAGTLNRRIAVPAEVRVNQDQIAHIVPRYPGLVLEVKKNIGDKVEKGDVLAVLEGNESLTPYELKSLIDGTIIEKHITLGESMKDDDVVFTIANLGSVWIDLTVYQKDIAIVSLGQTVVVSGGEHIPPAKGVISYLSPTVDTHTRTSLARVALPNPAGRWRPGMFVTGEIEISSRNAPVVVPREAVISVDGHPSLFVQTAQGLEPRPVIQGMIDTLNVEILKGLKPGEQYVSRNTLPLKAELNRAALEHAGHVH